MKQNTHLPILAALTLAASLFLLPNLSAQTPAPATTCPAPVPRAAAKVLTIGNSFADDATAFLPQIAGSTGRKLTLFRANLGGCSLERHARHLRSALANPSGAEGSPYRNDAKVLGISGKDKVSLPEALAAVEWDFVTIQQVSTASFKPETYEPHASEIIAAIRKYAPKAEIVIHQTWAYREDHALFKKDGGFTQQKMYDGLRAACNELSARHGNLRQLPSGDAMQAARATPRWQYQADKNFDFKNPPAGKLPVQKGSLNVGWRWREKDGRKEFALDAIHCNTAGRYLTGCVFYEGFYAADCTAATFVPQGLAKSDAGDLRQIAHSVSLGKCRKAAAADTKCAPDNANKNARTKITAQ
jgi:hypothetical protein